MLNPASSTCGSVSAASFAGAAITVRPTILGACQSDSSDKSAQSERFADTGVIQDPSYEQQTRGDGAPLTAPWAGEGPDGIGVDDNNGHGGNNKCGFI